MIGYLHIMSDEEVKDYHEKLDGWWVKLAYEIKGNIRSLVEPLLKVMNCEHDWYDTSTYENTFPAGTWICRECGQHKIKQKKGDAKI